MINDEQLLRYNRQIMVPQFDIAGQERLLASSVLIVGLGGLGCPVALYLAAAGVGELLLADGDRVELSNLQRQVAHGEADIGEPKVESAARSIARLNPQVRVETLHRRLDQDAMLELAGRVDLVVDATDSFSTRLDINRACLEKRVPWVSGAAIRSEGQVAVFDPTRDTACYRCLYPEGGEDATMSCAENGILAPVVGVIGTLQALEAMKLLAQFGEPLRGKLLMIDALSMDVRRLALQRNPDCTACGGGT